MKKWILIPVLMGLLSACATTHPGQEGVPTGKSNLPIKLSAYSVDDEVGAAFQLVEVTFENTSDDWLRIQRCDVMVGNPAESHLSVVVGRDLHDWSQAVLLQRRQDDYNKNIAQLGLLTVGGVATVAGGGSNNPALATAGLATMAGATAWSAATAIQSSYDGAERVEQTPENHIYQPFAVPARMFMRRWVLMNKPPHTVLKKFVLEVETVEGVKEKYVVNL